MTFCYSNNEEDKGTMTGCRELTEHTTPGIHDAVIKSVLDNLKPGAKVLDVGAGSGAFSFRLLKNNYIVTAAGIDQESFIVKEVPYIYIDLNTEFAAEYYGSFDAVVAIEVIEHLENIYDFFRKLKQVVKVGGIVFITTPNICSIRQRLTFLYRGIFTWFRPNCAYSRGGHIQIIPGWLLKVAAEKAKFCCLEMSGIGILFDSFYINKIKNYFISMLYYLFKLISKESFAGEFSSPCVLLVLRMDE